MVGADLTDDHADGDAHATDARFATHYLRLLRNAVKFSHALLLVRFRIMLLVWEGCKTQEGRKSARRNFHPLRSDHNPTCRNRTSGQIRHHGVLSPTARSLG
ncbi:hypothetical protein ACCAA_480023 [Candidatus Accumulibacter aalborgensis]|uniref:Uncharacterized protein n=1 Tax=Candidatus Accumulibacter aalborgensis TaxID=1860102 RepID=A0A1A8XT26_9PROT|nr:hypothetical protein ACCAA_480023 [Candidatus Accumulibacter aalborgensis]